mmetsp:Transcript_6198/g.18298  ORF Transcript_6198/g.18298 Transcript_6198/m.18298 type:complete len:391 (-) Transcript_6198:340-1512(-)
MAPPRPGGEQHGEARRRLRDLVGRLHQQEGLLCLCRGADESGGPAGVPAAAPLRQARHARERRAGAEGAGGRAGHALCPGAQREQDHRAALRGAQRGAPQDPEGRLAARHQRGPGGVGGAPQGRLQPAPGAGRGGHGRGPRDAAGEAALHLRQLHGAASDRSPPALAGPAEQLGGAEPLQAGAPGRREPHVDPPADPAEILRAPGQGRRRRGRPQRLGGWPGQALLQGAPLLRPGLEPPGRGGRGRRQRGAGGGLGTGLRRGAVLGLRAARLRREPGPAPPAAAGRGGHEPGGHAPEGAAQGHHGPLPGRPGPGGWGVPQAEARGHQFAGPQAARPRPLRAHPPGLHDRGRHARGRRLRQGLLGQERGHRRPAGAEAHGQDEDHEGVRPQ